MRSELTYPIIYLPHLGWTPRCYNPSEYGCGDIGINGLGETISHCYECPFRDKSRDQNIQIRFAYNLQIIGALSGHRNFHYEQAYAGNDIDGAFEDIDRIIGSMYDDHAEMIFIIFSKYPRQMSGIVLKSNGHDLIMYDGLLAYNNKMMDELVKKGDEEKEIKKKRAKKRYK